MNCEAMQKGKGVVLRKTTEDCICYVPSAHIQCHVCGAFLFGRIRVRCSQHPNTIYISDLIRCTKCLAPSCFLKELSTKKIQ